VLLMYEPPAAPEPSSVKTRGSASRARTVAGAGDLGLTPAAVPNSTPPEGTVPVGKRDCMPIDQNGNRGTRSGARWVADPGRTRIGAGGVY
jgi:hypothetical protein